MARRTTKRATSKTRPAARKRKAAPRKPRSHPQARSPQSEEVRIAVTFRQPSGGPGPVSMATRLSPKLAHRLKPDETQIGPALEHLQSLGFKTTAKGTMTASIRGSRALFEKVFGTRLSEFKIDESVARNAQARSFLYPAPDAPWNPDVALSSMIDEAYIQWPHIYMNQRFSQPPPSPIPPRIDYHHLRVPHDVAFLLNASRVHREGGTGKGVTVAMIDSGFAHAGHQYFGEQGYRTTTVLAPGATNVDEDRNSHGTGESANLLAVAPNVNFVGVKLDNDQNPREGASVLEGLQEALRHNPQVISVSLGYDLCPSDPATGRRTSNKHLTQLPNGLVALEAEIAAAVADGIVVVFSAGNGHVAFPGMMPDVLSAGGVFVDEAGAMLASDYASAFRSRIYPGRNVPDVCGLVGQRVNGAAYIMLPVQVGSELDRLDDKTAKDVGWGVFSGTSAAAPQLAGVCALLLEKAPSLTPADIKALLRRTARDVQLGSSNPASNADDGPIPAGAGFDGATGGGLVDVFEAWRQI